MVPVTPSATASKPMPPLAKLLGPRSAGGERLLFAPSPARPTATTSSAPVPATSPAPASPCRPRAAGHASRVASATMGTSSTEKPACPWSSVAACTGGRYFKAGETIVSGNCSTKCHCHPARGLVCEDVRCPPREVCATQDGTQRCVEREGKCRISPGAFLTTFDGAGGKLLVSGTYKVAALCNEQSPNWFKVVVEVSECRDDNIPAAVAVFVFFREAFITVNNNMEVWVNGLFTRLPATVSKTISLSAVAENITISHTSGMDVLFGPSGEVTVTVGAALVNRLCAPCGNFNGDASDDLKLPDGRAARTIAEVIDAWKARDFAGCD
ncbi:IgGFc-binding protein-like isoform 2-T2 [Pluvialis apricaria]